MKYQIVGKNVSITESMKSQIVKKLRPLEKFFIVKDADCLVVISIVPNGQKIEVTIPTKFGPVRGEVVNRDLYDAIDLVVDKLQEQIRKAKSKLDRRHRESLGKAFVLQEIEDVEGEGPAELVRTKSIEVRTIDLDTAIAEMELLGHSFFIYRDDEDEKIAVVYKRVNGGYGLIEVDN